MLWLYDLPLWLLGTLVLAVAIAYAAGAVWLVRHRGWRLDEGDNSTAAALHAFIGVLYAVALGLMVVAAQEANDDVEHAVSAEANAAGNLFRVMTGLDSAHRVQLRRQLAGYVQLVIHDEWAHLQRAEQSDTTWKAMDRLSAQVYGFVPDSPNEERVYPQLVDGMEEMLDARRDRLYLGEKGVGVLTWVVVVLGGMITVGFAAFFRMRSARAQLLLTSLAATMFGLMLFLLLAMDHPLWGRESVGPDAFRQLESNFVASSARSIADDPSPPRAG